MGQTLLETLREKTAIPTITYEKGSHNDYFFKDIKMSVEGSSFILVTANRKALKRLGF